MSLAAQIESIQPDLFYKLCSEPYFAPVSIFRLRDKRMGSELNQSLEGLGTALGGAGASDAAASGASYVRQGTGAGATIAVLMPDLVNPMGNTPGPVCTAECRFVVKTVETVNLGAQGTQLTCEAIAATIAQTFQLFSLGSGPGVLNFYVAESFWRKISTDFDPFLAIEITIMGDFVLTPVTRATGPSPVSVNNGNGTETVTLTDEQPGGGSALYWTSDGSFPGAANPSATVYSGPFTVPVNSTIRTAAYYPGLQGSFVDTFVVN